MLKAYVLGLTWLASAHSVLVPSAAAPTHSSDTPAFSYNSKSFLLHGEPYVIIGGQMDPQRIPPQYWRDRLTKARSMGLNTIFSYVFWNLLEPKRGQWTGQEDANNIAYYLQVAQEEGLNIVLRPGPYICGEREWGGFPAWLTEIPDMEVRTFNKPFLNATWNYLERLSRDLKDLQVTRGGPLLMVQVENEYGSYGSDHQYTAAMRDMLQQLFDVPLYTNDGGVSWTLAGGSVSGVLAAVDGDPTGAFEARQRYVTDETQLGPLLDGEYYTTAPDVWGAKSPHNAAPGARSAQAANFIRDIEYVLSANNSISLYMFHGGTNFGLANGALWKNSTAAFTTSYDYGAPLDESGRITELYSALRQTMLKYVPAESVPAPPAHVPLMVLPPVTLEPIGALFDVAAPKTASVGSPSTMEAIGQAYGFLLYEHVLTSAAQGFLRAGDRPRDRVLVYVNGVRKGVLDSSYNEPLRLRLSLLTGDTLQLLVENMGRVDYWSQEAHTFNGVTDPFKGINGDVFVGDTILNSWNMTSYSLDKTPTASRNLSSKGITVGSPPMLYSGSFKFNGSVGDNPAKWDTFLSIPNGVKGVVWVNGFNLGRYWIIGPQQSLYLPGVVLRPNKFNDVVVLELEPEGSEMVAIGEAERVWANNPDPDAPHTQVVQLVV